MLLFTLLLPLFLTSCLSWGPLSHLFFASQAFPNDIIMGNSMKTGVDFPDGTYFANWSEFPNCPLPVANFHNGITAGYFYQFAASPQGQTFKSPTFDPVSFAIGYGSHMIADQVGFYPKYGYLGTVPSYVTFFPFMTAIDALVTTLTTFPENEAWSSDEASAFIAACTSYYNQLSPSFPVFNTSSVADCAVPWGQTDDQLFALAKLQASTGYYQQALVFYDLFNATTFSDAKNHFLLSNFCAVSAVQFWGSLMAKNTSPEQAYNSTMTEITQYFNQGLCYATN